MRLADTIRGLLLVGTCLGAFAATSAQAQTAAPAAAAPAASGTAAAPAAPAAPAPPPGYWINGIHFGAQLEGSMTVNPAAPDSGVNFGRMFDDRANQPLLNQLMLTVNKPIDSSAAGFDWGFKLQGLYGSDARYTHFLGVFDQNPGPAYRNQFDILEADLQAHVPFPTAGGMDIKAGMYPTPLGYEVIDPSANPFFSHSYIFNFGLPLKHTGGYVTAHVTPLLDLYLGIDTGENTSAGCCRGDNNNSIAGLGGFGLNMMGGNLTLLALTHIGPENANRALSPFGFNADKYLRYESDVVLTWKATDSLTLTTEANWIRDDFDGAFTKGKPTPANAFGVAQYISYNLSDNLVFNARAEIYRDDNGFFVANVTGNNDFVRGELGMPLFSPTLGTAGVGTTYGEITVGLTVKPTVPGWITGLLIRPELRVDSALSGGHPFGSNATATSAVTIASDFVLTF